MGDVISRLTDMFKPNSEKKNRPFTSAVVLCAGIGQRFSVSGRTKQNAVILGIPVAVHTLLAFERCEIVDEVIVVVREEEIGIFEEYCARYPLAKVTQIIVGGATRQESSLKGFDAIDDRAGYVLIHDGARCLVTPEIIDRTVRAAYDFGAAAAAEKSRDTVKYSAENDYIEDTIDRDHVWLVKTPQVFLSNMYRAAAYTAKKDMASVTDDCMMAERLGFKIKLVECGSQNIKITYPEDIVLAEAILKSREGTEL